MESTKCPFIKLQHLSTDQTLCKRKKKRKKNTD